MEPLTYEALQRDPELLAKLLRDARRERARAMGELFAAAIGAVRRRLPSPFSLLRSHSLFASKG
jgi:hypothetical protein